MDGRPNRRNKAAYFSGVMWTVPAPYWSPEDLKMLRVC